MKEFQDRFIEAFCEALLAGNDAELIGEYSAILISIAEKAWHSRHMGRKSEYPLERLQNNCRRLLQAAADSDRTVSKILFLKLLVNLYRLTATDYLRYEKGAFVEKLTAPIPRQKFEILEFSNEIDFFANILSKIDIADLQSSVASMSEFNYYMTLTDLSLFIESLDTAALKIFMKLSIEESSFSYVWQHDSPLRDIYQNLGWYLKKQTIMPGINDQSYSAFTINCIFDKSRLDHLSISPEIKRLLVQSFYYDNAIYVCGLIAAGLGNTVINVLLPYISEGNYYWYDDIYELVLPIAPFCCIYYLGFWEEDSYVEAEIRKQARCLAKELSGHYNVLLQKKTVLDFIAGDIGNLSTLECVMNRFDLRRQQQRMSVAKELADDFSLFSILFSSLSSSETDSIKANTFHRLNERNLPEYLLYIKANRKDKILKLVSFIEFMGGFESGQREQLAETLFNRLSDSINSRKNEIKIEFAENEKEYRANPKAEYEKALKDGILTRIAEEYKDMIVIEDDAENRNAVSEKPYKTIEVMADSVFTSYLLGFRSNDIIERIAYEAYTSLLQKHMEEIIRMPKIPRKNHFDFKSELSYLKFFKNSNFKLIIGSYARFLPFQDYWEEFEEVTKSCKSVISDGTSYSIALKNDDIRFYVKNLNVAVSDATMDNYDISYESPSSAETSSAGKQIANPFESQEEFKSFVVDSRKIIKVTAQIKVDIPDDASGFYFKAGRYYVY